MPAAPEGCNKGFFTLNRHLKHRSAVLGHEESFQASHVEELPQSNTEWALWEQVVPNSSGGKFSYGSNLKLIAAFSTFQDFWAIWENLPQPSELLMNKNMISDGSIEKYKSSIDALMIFQSGIKPMWEDIRNKHGGLFEFIFKKDNGKITPAQIDEAWNNLVVAVVGGCIDPNGMINGVRLVDKLSTGRGVGFLRIEVWFSNFDDEENRMNLKFAVETAMGTRLNGTYEPIARGECKEFSTKRK